MKRLILDACLSIGSIAILVWLIIVLSLSVRNVSMQNERLQLTVDKERYNRNLAEIYYKAELAQYKLPELPKPEVKE